MEWGKKRECVPNGPRVIPRQTVVGFNSRPPCLPITTRCRRSSGRIEGSFPLPRSSPSLSIYITSQSRCMVMREGENEIVRGAGAALSAPLRGRSAVERSFRGGGKIRGRRGLGVGRWRGKTRREGPKRAATQGCVQCRRHPTQHSILTFRTHTEKEEIWRQSNEGGGKKQGSSSPFPTAPSLPPFPPLVGRSTSAVPSFLAFPRFVLCFPIKTSGEEEGEEEEEEERDWKRRRRKERDGPFPPFLSDPNIGPPLVFLRKQTPSLLLFSPF